MSPSPIGVLKINVQGGGVCLEACTLLRYLNNTNFFVITSEKGETKHIALGIMPTLVPPSFIRSSVVLTFL